VLFPRFVEQCHHNPPTLQTDGQTDGRHARSISSKRIISW